jgi:hypothetical protein
VLDNTLRPVDHSYRSFNQQGLHQKGLVSSWYHISSMQWTEWLLAAVFAVPAVALAAWFRLLMVEMKEEEEKKKRHKKQH